MKEIIVKKWFYFKQKLCRLLQKANEDRVFLFLGSLLIFLSFLTVRSEIYSRQLRIWDWPSFFLAASYEILTIPGLISLWLMRPVAFSILTVFPFSTLGVYLLTRLSYIPRKCKSVVGFAIMFLSAYSLAGETFSPLSVHHFGDSSAVWVPGIFLSISAIIGFFILFDSNRVYWGPVLLFFGLSYLGLWCVDLYDFYYCIGRRYYHSDNYTFLAISLFFLFFGLYLSRTNRREIFQNFPKNTVIIMKYLLHIISFAAVIVDLSYLYSVRTRMSENYWLFISLFATHVALLSAMYYSDWTDNSKTSNGMKREIYYNFFIASHVIGALVVLFFYPYFYYFILPSFVTGKWYGTQFFLIVCVGILSQSAELILLRHSQISMELSEAT
jgi:hypothetical protein